MHYVCIEFLLAFSGVVGMPVENSADYSAIIRTSTWYLLPRMSGAASAWRLVEKTFPSSPLRTHPLPPPSSCSVPSPTEHPDLGSGK